MHDLWYDAPAALDRPVSDRDRPARAWSAALPLGNGRVGAMIYGGVPRDQVLLNEKTIWAGPPVPAMQPDARRHVAELRRLLSAGRHFDAERYCQSHLLAPRISPRSYQPAGYLSMELGHGDRSRARLPPRGSTCAPRSPRWSIGARASAIAARRSCRPPTTSWSCASMPMSRAVGVTFALQHPAGGERRHRSPLRRRAGDDGPGRPRRRARGSPLRDRRPPDRRR